MKAASSRARARKLLASVAAALAATLTLGTPTAQAEDHSNSYPEGYPKVGASSESMAGFWLNVKKQDGTSGHVMPNLFTVHTSASKEGAIKAYCIELDVNIKYESDLRVGDWKDFPGTNKFKDNADVQSKVAWIAQRSYPQTDLAQLIQTTSIAGLTEQEAITATQAAIWHFTNDYQWSGLKDADQAATARVQQLYTYLTGQNNTGLKETPQPTVEAQGSSISFTRSENGSEGKVGPIRFTSTQSTFKLTSELKYELVNAQGAKVDVNAVPVDTDLYLKVPADMTSGEQEFKASVTGSIYAGKLLITKDAVAGGPHGQTIIIGSNKEVTTEVQGKISWSVTQQTTPPGTPCQPNGSETSQTGNNRSANGTETNQTGNNRSPNGGTETSHPTSTETSQTGNNCATNGTEANQTGNNRSGNGSEANQTGNNRPGNGSEANQTGNNRSGNGSEANQTGKNCAPNGNTETSRPATTATTTVTAPAPADPPAIRKPGLPKTGNN
ncbi:thioester domain-containing protein [[Pseudopropionibacterium] massiliense]|uniref:thioester domain-containing protein n=1 Tax=[Pseudopropionibacterium] massiliense TaxID=2220000 RepID=UPI00102FDAE2|nr:thioester domain-containing protein [[Pseudopropionibacterium] massiliense]